MRAADFSWEAPPSPVKTTISSPLLLLFYCVTSVAPFPQKSLTLALITVRGCLPQSLHSPQFSEPDPIYPYLPFLFCLSLWQRPCQLLPSWRTSNLSVDLGFGSQEFRVTLRCRTSFVQALEYTESKSLGRYVRFRTLFNTFS